jgi:hypothetical protein
LSAPANREDAPGSACTYSFTLISSPSRQESKGDKERREAHLIRDKDSNVKLFADPGESGKHLVELLLSLRELSSSGVIDSEESHDGIDDLRWQRGDKGQ